ncbi:hypothetical protein ACQPW3_22260 [Actinosynnema sp. CA-248983]
MTITARHLPTPDLALRSSDPVELRRVRSFAVDQAAASEDARRKIIALAPRSGVERERVLEAVHEDLMVWRHRLASSTTRRLGTGLAHDATRYRKRLSAEGPNYDRLGYLGRLREAPVWDSAAATYVGGVDTPAHRIMLSYGTAALERFEREGGGEMLENPVLLPDGTTVIGNSLVRGDAARTAGRELAERIGRRGGDPSRVELGGDPIYVVTAPTAARSVMFRAALRLLATADDGDLPAWQQARYLLFQAPVTKKGSDAVTRAFLVAIGAVLFGQPPTMEQDADLRCMVLGQTAATTMPSDSLIFATAS